MEVREEVSVPTHTHTHTHTHMDRETQCIVMDAQETMIGEVIGQFYSFFGGMMNLRDTLSTSPGINQSVRDRLLQQLTELEGVLLLFT